MAKADTKKPDPEKLEQAVTETTAKIATAYGKLATKFRARAQHAANRMKDTKKEDKRAVHRRRFEIYGDAATDLEERIRQYRGGSDDTDM